MNRLRALSRDYLLPLVLGALVLRALIPAGFMPGNAVGFSLTATMCAPLADSPADPASENIEIPGGGMAHCDYCVAPLWGATDVASPGVGGIAPQLAHDLGREHATPFSRFALTRAQIPRAPPAS